MEEVITTKEWVIFLLKFLIPFYGIYLVFKYAFGKDVNTNYKNLVRSQLVMVGIVLAVYLVIVVAVVIFTLSLGLMFAS